MKDEPTRVTVTNVDISFGQMVVLMVKFAFATVPAAAAVAGLVGFGVLAGALLLEAMK